MDWKDNPTEFKYKLSENDETKKANIKSVKEFGIDNISKYIRSTVNIDRSSENIYRLSINKKPIFKEEELFLKVLVEGKANLYLYEDGDLKRFFYKKENTGIKQLVYKSYRTSDNEIGKNNIYKNELWRNLNCSTFKRNKAKNLEYYKNSLIDFFVEYNQCSGKEYINYYQKQKKDLFNLSFRPGLNNSSLSILTQGVTDFDSKLTFRFGLEAEFVMPFNKNKWSVIIEPTYQYFKSKNNGFQNIAADYKSIELPIGIRHYLFINESSKIFMNGSLIIDLSYDSEIDFESETNLEITTRPNLAFGLGYKYNDKYSLELRYQTPREILNENTLNNFLYSDYQTLSVIFGYSIF
jgi:hypothetical protein